ncbi:hypothetical protein DFH09DRAFT_1505296, partial [Mycena vulgaris]
SFLTGRVWSIPSPSLFSLSCAGTKRLSTTRPSATCVGIGSESGDEESRVSYRDPNLPRVAGLLCPCVSAPPCATSRAALSCSQALRPLHRAPALHRAVQGRPALRRRVRSRTPSASDTHAVGRARSRCLQCAASLPRRQGHRPPPGSASTAVSSRPRVRVSSPSPRGAPSPCPQSSYASPVDGGRSSTRIILSRYVGSPPPSPPNVEPAPALSRSMSTWKPLVSPLPARHDPHPSRSICSCSLLSNTRTVLCATGAAAEARHECVSCVCRRAAKPRELRGTGLCVTKELACRAALEGVVVFENERRREGWSNDGGGRSNRRPWKRYIELILGIQLLASSGIWIDDYIHALVRCDIVGWQVVIE